MYSQGDARKTRKEKIAGLKLVVCATLMGRATPVFREDNWREQKEPYPGADSHVSNKGQEYIVFSNARILPCYVIHLHWGTSTPKTFRWITKLVHNRREGTVNKRRTAGVLAPGDVKRLKDERLARARKFFAYGFGPVEGNKLVIEDIADSDDDEEDYGWHYEQNNVDFFNGKGQEEQTIWDWKPNGLRMKDQYGRERREILS